MVIKERARKESWIVEPAPGAPVGASVHWPGKKIQYMRLFGKWLLCSHKTEMSLFDTVIARVLWRHVTHLLQNNKDLGLSSTTQPPPSSRCKAQSCRCKRAHSNTRKPMKNIKRYLLNMAYVNSFKIKAKQNNSKRPVDALAEKHISPTDNLNSRDASASKNCRQSD